MSSSTFTASTPALSNSYVLARAYNDQVPLALSQPIKATGRSQTGGYHYNITSDSKPLVLVLSGAEVKVATTARDDTVLILSKDGLQSDVIVKALADIRSRLVSMLGITDAQMKSLMVDSTPKARFGKKKAPTTSTLFLNPEPTATLVNTDKETVDPDDIKGKNCTMGIFLRIRSVFKHPTGQYTCVFKVGHMVLVSVNDEINVEPLDMTPVAPISEDLASGVSLADLL